jgi:hypothetical protein
MAQTRQQYAEGVEFTAPIPDEFAEILTPEAVSFVAKLSREFGGRVEEILPSARSRSTPARCLTFCPRLARSGRATGR